MIEDKLEMDIKYYPLKYVNLGFDELIFYLSQIVLSKTNERIKKKHEEFLESRELLRKSKEELREVRSTLLTYIQEYERIQILHEVVCLIDTLRKEGALLGGDRQKMMNLLGKIKDKDVTSLKSLKNNLLINVPVSTGKTMII